MLVCLVHTHSNMNRHMPHSFIIQPGMRFEAVHGSILAPPLEVTRAFHAFANLLCTVIRLSRQAVSTANCLTAAVAHAESSLDSTMNCRVRSATAGDCCCASAPVDPEKQRALSSSLERALVWGSALTETQESVDWEMVQNGQGRLYCAYAAESSSSGP